MKTPHYPKNMFFDGLCRASTYNRCAADDLDAAIGAMVVEALVLGPLLAQCPTGLVGLLALWRVAKAAHRRVGSGAEAEVVRAEAVVDRRQGWCRGSQSENETGQNRANYRTPHITIPADPITLPENKLTGKGK